MQKQGSEQLEVWAPTSKQPSLRFLISIAAEQEMHLHQMDVKSAFLNAELDEDVYIQLPPELETGGDRQVYQLQKAVYGLKQAPRAWYNKLKDLLAGLGFKQSEADPAVYFQFMNGQLEIILTHVDDLLIAAADLNRVQWIKEQLKGLVDIKDMGPASYYLGMEISRKDGKILLTQHKYTRELLEKFSPMGLRGRDSPLEDKTQISRTAGVKLTEEKASKYRETVGALMYLQTGTRPDLAYAVGLLARFFQSPTELHMDLLTSVMRLQPTVAVSTMEAEYMAASAAAKEALWLRKLMCELQVSDKPVHIWGDNQSALCVLKDPISSARSKHIDTMHHFVRERIQMGQLTYQYISTADMVADILTKATKVAVFHKMRNQMGLVEWE
ncbi:hypothetical protein CEUSTIGMA_g1173.t1 [Chlamydomonas eustigma]|uniref:Reverse transcriptase Ty1/copia-type domain-containing protein n=1 Tax=Chlamydomonas eustigma TaxID=1157962 RepID=A0A250WT68_9CHLO|nr:hypothetical protein CEUSTIGMA_g1173.t1 [Chlamydomonas eustigma]|eukprot:GAX73720.1 hypothetical protein CEUSTIGMA_g1173.t1 [Chlamydomonas eustigma]